MPEFHFEAEERSIYRFVIEANNRDQAIQLFCDHGSLYITDDNLHNIHLDYDITE